MCRSILFLLLLLILQEVCSFYNGIRISHKCVDARAWYLNANTISIDSECVIDVPIEYNDTNKYSASLAHKSNHAFTNEGQNAKYDL